MRSGVSHKRKKKEKYGWTAAMNCPQSVFGVLDFFTFSCKPFNRSGKRYILNINLVNFYTHPYLIPLPTEEPKV